jgi:hypothetical protein
LYNELRQDYNRAVQKYPLAIVYCREKDDVCNAVRWAEEHGVSLRIRSKGHHCEGYSNGNCTLIIDVSEMTGIDLNEEAGLLFLQGGVTHETVCSFVSSRGYPFPGGTCPAAGVVGCALGGGWGLSCRYLGLGCDSLVEIELVNFEGKLIRASLAHNADLFWACRGAGAGNFGVIVSMTFSLPERVGKVTLIEIDYLHRSRPEQEAFLEAWQKWLHDADNRVTLIARIYNSPEDGPAMLVRGIFYGEPDEAARILKSFLDLDAAVLNLESVSFLEAATLLGSACPPFELFTSASRFVGRDLEPGEINRAVDLIQDRAPGSVFAGLSLYALGGRVAQVGTDETAFFYREAHYIIRLETVWEDELFARDNTVGKPAFSPTLRR